MVRPARTCHEFIEEKRFITVIQKFYSQEKRDS